MNSRWAWYGKYVPTEHAAHRYADVEQGYYPPPRNQIPDSRAQQTIVPRVSKQQLAPSAYKPVQISRGTYSG